MASERYFDRRCFDQEKLERHHKSHSEIPVAGISSSTRSIDILCEDCRRAFSRAPWEFLYDDPVSPPASDFAAYMQSRSDKQASFLAELRVLYPIRATNLEEELQRLSKHRTDFAAYGPNRRLLASLSGWRNMWAASRGWEDSADEAVWLDRVMNEGLSAELVTPPRLGDLEGRDGEEPVGRGGARTEDSRAKPVVSPPRRGGLEEQHGGSKLKVGVMGFWRRDKHLPFYGTSSLWSWRTPGSQFPDQQIPLDDVLSGDDDKMRVNPLRMECDRDVLRYFHFPANNMSWIEVRGRVPRLRISNKLNGVFAGGHGDVLR
jgi:hypothetical protein